MSWGGGASGSLLWLPHAPLSPSLIRHPSQDPSRLMSSIGWLNSLPFIPDPCFFYFNQEPSIWFLSRINYSFCTCPQSDKFLSSATFLKATMAEGANCCGKEHQNDQNSFAPKKMISLLCGYIVKVGPFHPRFFFLQFDLWVG